MCLLSKCNFFLSPSARQHRRFGNSPFYAVSQASYWGPVCRRRSLSWLAVALSQSIDEATPLWWIQQTPQNKAVYAIYAIYMRIFKIVICILTLMYIVHCFLCIRANILLIRFLLKTCECEFVCSCTCTCSDVHSGNSFSNQGLNIDAKSKADFHWNHKFKPKDQKKSVLVPPCWCDSTVRMCECVETFSRLFFLFFLWRFKFAWS